MAMAKGYSSVLALDFESTYGVDPSPNAIQMPVNSFDVRASRSLNTPQTITGTRNPVAPFAGNTQVGGSAVVPVDAIGMGYWLKALFGAPTTTGSGPYVHTFKVGASQPSLLLEKKIATASATYMKYNGCKINKFSMAVGGDGELTANLDILGAKETVGTTAFDSTLTTFAMNRFNNFQATMKEGGSTISNATEFSFDIDTGLDGDVYLIGGGGVRGDLPEGIFTLTGTLKTMFENTTLLNKALNSTESSLEVTLTNGANILKINFPEVLFQINTPGITGPKGIYVELPFTAYYTDDANASSVMATLTNTQATYA